MRVYNKISGKEWRAKNSSINTSRSAYDMKMFTEEDFRRQRQQEVLHRVRKL